MAIKQLQLRGISRTPSDRASADGGCAESLNVHLDGGEVAPTLPPKDISADIYPSTVPSGEGRYDYRIVYIHKMRGITNYIGIKHDTTNHNYKFRAYGSSLSVTQGATTYSGMSFMGNALTAEDEEPRNFVGVGNMLIAYTSKRPYYFLFKDNAYTYLGGSIPQPNIEIATFKNDNRSATVEIKDEFLKTTATASDWNGSNLSGSEHEAGLLSTMDDLWGGVKIAIGEARNAGIFVTPFFIRYALRLYDGSYIYASSPILCGGEVAENWMRARVVTAYGQEAQYEISLSFLNAFSVYIKGSAITSTWKDIVKSIDFFASTPNYTPAMEAKYATMTSESAQSWPSEIIFEGMTADVRNKTIRDEVFSKGQFYKIKSIELTDSVEMGKLEGGTLRLLNSDAISGDNLVVQELMPLSYRDGAQYIPDASAKNYNNRLLLVGAKEILSRGDTALNGQAASETWGDSLPGHSTYTLRYTIVDSATGASHQVLAHYRNGTSSLHPSFFKAASATSAPSLHYGNETAGTGVFKRCFPYAWLCYPDARCTQVEVFCSANVNGKVIPMEPHPYLDCACAFLGYGVSLSNPGSAYANVTTPGTFTEDREIDAENKIFLSEMDNPFLFPAENIVSFQDKLIDVAAISVPLSEGQMGDFNIYVFTEGGIRVLITTAEGTFAATLDPPNVSRHIAIPGTILGMEQAIVFTTERGVMLLSGNNVQELSAEMNGKPVLFDDGLADSGQVNSEMRNLIQGSVWAGLFNPMNDTNTFMQFVRSAKPAYDYNGGRLVFFHTTKQYQYEYRFTTQSWHKIYTSVANPTILNSYPDCYVSWFSNGSGKVLNFTTFLNSDTAISDTKVVDGQTVRNEFLGTIITRPIDLGEPDIRKAIRSIRVRGKYGRGAVQYVLLGSFDNIHWCRMKSLRGGSYKYFRIILLTSLTPNERITWIDVDYESRFTNRLR